LLLQTNGLYCQAQASNLLGDKSIIITGILKLWNTHYRASPQKLISLGILAGRADNSFGTKPSKITRNSSLQNPSSPDDSGSFRQILRAGYDSRCSKRAPKHQRRAMPCHPWLAVCRLRPC